MDFSKLLLLAIFSTTVVLLVSRRLRPDVVAVLTLVALAVTGLLTPSEALSGFSTSAVVTLAALFVMAAALERTGAATWLAARLSRLSGTDEIRIALVYMLAGAALSLVMNNIAAGAVLLPAAMVACRQNAVSPSKVLMPMAFGTLLGGMATLFTTANLVVSGALQAQGQRGLGMLDFMPAGGLVLAVGVGVMLVLGRRLLPGTSGPSDLDSIGIHLARTYQLQERLWEIGIPEGSCLVGQSLAALPLGEKLGVSTVGLFRGGQAHLPVAADEVLRVEDVLLVAGREERIRGVEDFGARFGRAADGSTEARLAVHLMEAVIAPRSPYIGKTLRALGFRRLHPVTAVALWRDGRSYRTDVGDFSLQPGDALLFVGSDDALAGLHQDTGLVLTHRPPVAVLPPGWLTVKTVTVAGLAIVLSAVGVVSTAVAMLAAAAAFVLVGSVRHKDVYRLVEWPVVVLVAGLLPLGTALVKTGLADDVARLCTSAVPPGHPLVLVAALSLLALVLTQFIGGQVAALIIGPVAVNAATHMGVNPSAMGVAVSIMCSAAFLTPTAHPVNLLVLSAGGYTFRDFVKVGIPMTVATFLALLAGMRLFWGLSP